MKKHRACIYEQTERREVAGGGEKIDSSPSGICRCQNQRTFSRLQERTPNRSSEHVTPASRHRKCRLAALRCGAAPGQGLGANFCPRFQQRIRESHAEDRASRLDPYGSYNRNIAGRGFWATFGDAGEEEE